MPSDPHPCFPAPDNRNVKIWRYMDLAKFVSLMHDSALHFARADQLGDPFEGSVPLKSSIEVFAKEVAANPELQKQPLPGDSTITYGKWAEMLKTLAAARRGMRAECYCSCWHMNEHESSAMWRLYCQSNEAICVQSTFELLNNALPSWTHFGCVAYVDYEQDEIPGGNLFTPVMTKRKSFEHEREVRAIAWSALSAEKGGEEIAAARRGNIVRVSVALRNTIQAIYVSPTSPAWFRDVVNSLLEKYDLPLTAKQSSLDAIPLY